MRTTTCTRLLLASVLLVLGCGDSGAPAPELSTSGETGGEPSLDAVGGEEPADVMAPGPDAVSAGDAGPDLAGDADGSDDSSESDAGDEDAAADAGVPAEDVTVDPGPDPSDGLFGIDRVFEVEVSMDPDDWDSLRAETRTFFDLLIGEDCIDQPFPKPWNVYPATVSIDGVVLQEVGIRKKGFFGSLSEDRPSLKIKTDEYVDGQELLGLHRITLNNNQQDPSNLNACLTYRRFAAAGHPAPRCGFAKVSVNGQELGVYSHVESVKKRMLARHFDENDGNLYEGTLSDFRASRQNTFEKKTNKSEADFSDIQAAVDALAYEGDDWLEEVEAVFDVDSFLTFWALEVMVNHWDGYNANNNNFFVYADPDDAGRFTFMPWGADSAFVPAFAGENAPYPPSVMANSALSRRLYLDPVMRAKYQERLVELLDTIWDEDALAAEVEQMKATVLPAMPAGYASYMADDIPRIHAYIKGLRAAIMKDLEGGGPVWDIQLADAFCWVEGGGVDVTFSTTWGSLGQPNGFETGTGTVAAWADAVQAFQIDQVGAMAGVETEGVNAGRPVVIVLGLKPDGVIEFLWMTFASPAMITTGSTVEIDFQTAEGYRFEFYPPYNQPAEFRGYLVGGEVTFTEATPIPGAAIEATLKTPFYAPAE